MATRIPAPAVKMRKAPQQARSRETVDAILQAAARILCRRGWAKFTTNEVAEVAGVSVGSLYQYFPNKSALVAAIRRRHNEDVIAALTAATGPNRAHTIEGRAARLVRDIVVAHEVDPKLHAVLEQVPRDPASPARGEYYDVKIAHHIALLRLDGAEDPARTAVAAHVLWGALEGIMHLGSRYGQLTEPGFEDEMRALVESYLRSRADGAARVRSGRRRLAAS